MQRIVEASHRVGVAIDATEIHAVCLRRNAVCWATRLATTGGDLAGTLTEVFTRVRAAHGRTSSVGIAVGPAFARVTPHDGTSDRDTRTVASPVRMRGERPWVATFSCDVLDALAQTSEQTGMTVRSVVPTIDVLARGLAAVYDARVLWPPATPRVVIQWTAGLLESVTELEPQFAFSQPSLAAVPALAALGSDAVAFADAYGAARSDVAFGETGPFAPTPSPARAQALITRPLSRHESPAIRGAFTLIELIVVIAIIATLAAIVAPTVFRNVGDARTSAAKSQIEVFALALNAYRLDNDDFPTTEQGLEALRTVPTTGDPPRNWRGPYLSQIVPLDPWGRPYVYVAPGKTNPQSFDLYTLGRDGKPGGMGEDGDITSWGGPVEP